MFEFFYVAITTNQSGDTVLLLFLILNYFRVLVSLARVKEVDFRIDSNNDYLPISLKRN